MHRLSTLSVFLLPVFAFGQSGTLNGVGVGLNGALHGYKPMPGSAWYTDISQAPVDAANNAVWQSLNGPLTFHPDFCNPTTFQCGIPYTVVQSAPFSNTVPSVGESDESDDVPWPVKGNEAIEGGVTGCWPDDGGDHHMLVLDKSTGWLYESYQAKFCGGQMKTYVTSLWDLKVPEEKQHPFGRTSVDAAGLSVFMGLIRYDEIVAGVIDHAIRFTMNNTSCVYYTYGDCHGGITGNATHYAVRPGGGGRGNIGERIRLRADFDISGYSRTNQIILTAMKKYGMILADNGGNGYFQGTADTRWSDDDLRALQLIPMSNFDVVSTGPVRSAQLNEADPDNQVSVVTDATGGQVANPTPPPAIKHFGVSATVVAEGFPVMFTAMTKGAGVAYVSGAGPIRDALIIFPKQTATYQLTVLNTYGLTRSKPIMVTVQKGRQGMFRGMGALALPEPESLKSISLTSCTGQSCVGVERVGKPADAVRW